MLDPVPVAKPRRRTIADAQRQLTRKRLLKAARSTFAVRGYAAVTVDDIAVAADASRATFYLHFRSKAAALEALMRDGIPGSRAHFAKLDRLGVPSRAQVAAWIEETIGYWRRHGREIDVMRQATAVEPGLGSLAVELVEESLMGLSNFIARAPGGPDIGRVQATALILQLEQFCFFWLVRGASYDRDAAVEVLTDLWYAKVGPLPVRP